MASALRLYFLLLIVLVPIGGQAGPLIVDQIPGEKVFMTISDTADSPQITVPVYYTHLTLPTIYPVSISFGVVSFTLLNR